MKNVLNLAPECKLTNEQETPVVTAPYDLTPDEVLLSQEHYESEVRSYPRRLPIAIKTSRGVIVEDTKGQLYLDCLAASSIQPINGFPNKSLMFLFGTPLDPDLMPTIPITFKSVASINLIFKISNFSFNDIIN